MILPDTSPCLEGSTERSDGRLGRSLRSIASVAWNEISGWYRDNAKQGECDSPQQMRIFGVGRVKIRPDGSIPASVGELSF